MRLAVLFLFGALLPTVANAQCQLCAATGAPEDAAPSRPLTIEIETSLDFSRAAHATGNGGSIAIDERSGARAVTGGLIGLGGMALKGAARLTGEPFRHVRIGLPASIQLTGPGGDNAEVSDLRTDLPSDPILDSAGMLNFSFGGRLIVSGGASGDLRGRIPITAEYQ